MPRRGVSGVGRSEPQANQGLLKQTGGSPPARPQPPHAIPARQELRPPFFAQSLNDCRSLHLRHLRCHAVFERHVIFPPVPASTLTITQTLWHDLAGCAGRDSASIKTYFSAAPQMLLVAAASC
jgi:hypothetical protein